MHSCSSHAGITTERSESGEEAGVVMRPTTPANSDVLLRDGLFRREFFPTASPAASAIPLLPAPCRAPSTEYRKTEALERLQFRADQNASRTTRSVAQETSCLRGHR